jgi:hypothetical protein
MRNRDQPATYNDCIKQVTDKHDVNITRYNVYQITKGDRPISPDSLSAPTKFTDIDPSMKVQINARIYDLRDKEDPPTYKDCQEIIQNEYNVEVDKNVIYNAVKNGEKIIDKSETSTESNDQESRSDEARDNDAQEVVKYVDLPDTRKDHINERIISLRDDGNTYNKCISIVREEEAVIINRNTIYNVATKRR